MPVKILQRLGDRTIFLVENLEHYGVPDPPPEKFTLVHAQISGLPGKTREEMNADSGSYGIASWYEFEVGGKTVVFRSEHDNDWSSATYRHSEESISGPYVLVYTEETSDEEFLALTLVDGVARISFLTADGQCKFVDEKNQYHSLLYTYSIEGLLLRKAVEELEYLVNSKSTQESDLQEFFERYPDFILGEGYGNLHSKIVLENTKGENLIPDFMLEPADTSKLCDILELKKPSQKIYIFKKNRIRFSAAVLEAAAQLRTYGSYFEDSKQRDNIYKQYGLLAYKPRLFVIIGRTGEIDPILRKQIDSDVPSLILRTYDDILARMKDKIRK
ncbi:MAG: DUF4263 domain-containing protein [candidate division Zixibacteria bacterium]|nr:DUF4263 domain-containing protein [candidate division Zixibacteria bacterium]